MNLKLISDEALVCNLRTLIHQERKLLGEILEHLKEVDSRRIHLREGYPSLFEYAVSSLGYSEAQAYRRISAMRLLKDLPEAKPLIESGDLNLTHLTQAQEYFRTCVRKQEPVSRESKIDLLQTLKNKSTRETETVFAKLAPETVFRERERPVSEEKTEIRFFASKELLEKLKRFQDLDAHALGGQSYAVLFQRLVDLALKGRNSQGPEKGTDFSATKKSKVEKTVVQRTGPKTIKQSTRRQDRENLQLGEPHQGGGQSGSRFIPIALKRAIWRRDQGKCQFLNPATGRICGSTRYLQFEHKQPFARGGGQTEENLMLLCRAHNLYQAERSFPRQMKEILKN